MEAMTAAALAAVTVEDVEGLLRFPKNLHETARPTARRATKTNPDFAREAPESSINVWRSLTRVLLGSSLSTDSKARLARGMRPSR